ncbi:thiopurine S-methyltransferase [Colwellia sp. MEBiC06753]
MNPEFWHKCWETGALGFHQDDLHPFLIEQLAKLSIKQTDTVLVPLCGKSMDMLWWAQRCQVIGAELSEIACHDFFNENKLDYQCQNKADFQEFRCGNLSIYQGDFFSLEPALLPSVHYIYDRAALIALPEKMQAQYAAHLAKFINQDTELYLISVEYPLGELAGPPFAIDKTKVQQLFSGFKIECLAKRAIPDKQFARRSLKVSALTETLYRITR